MKDPSGVRVLLVSGLLMAVPITPLWLAPLAAMIFGWHPRAAEMASGFLAAVLFVGVAGIAWELFRRAQDAERGREEQRHGEY